MPSGPPAAQVRASISLTFEVGAAGNTKGWASDLSFTEMMPRAVGLSDRVSHRVPEEGPEGEPEAPAAPVAAAAPRAGRVVALRSGAPPPVRNPALVGALPSADREGDQGVGVRPEVAVPEAGARAPGASRVSFSDVRQNYDGCMHYFGPPLCPCLSQQAFQA